MKKQSHNKAIGVGVAALAAAAAGAYYLYGSSKGKAHRKMISSWILKAKAEIMEEIEKMKDVNEDAYKAIVTKVTDKYKGIKGMDREELAKLATQLKGHWKDIKKDIGKAIAVPQKASKK